MKHAYFLYHSIGQYPGKARELAQAMSRFADFWGTPDDDQWPQLLGLRAEFIARWCDLLHAPTGSLTTCESVTQGLHAFMLALPPQSWRGKKVLVAADCFPSIHFLLSKMQERLGFVLDTVPMREGAHWVEPEDFVAAWQSDVALAWVTWVSSTSSHRVDVATLVAHARRMGSLIGVDITQAAGLLPFDVTALGVDFTLSTSLKWLCGTPGAGILYVAPHLLPRCQPELRGWFSQPNPFNWALDRFSYADDMRRFDHGTPSCMAAVASLPALQWHAQQDKVALLTKNRQHTEWIMTEAAACGLHLISPTQEEKRGGSVMLQMPDRREGALIVNVLRQQGMHIDARGATLRVSPGFITSNDDVHALLRALLNTVQG